jgi:hypothetical protein
MGTMWPVRSPIMSTTVGHLQPAAVHLGLPEERYLQALAQLLLAPRLVEEDHVETAAAVAHHGLDDGPTVAPDALGDGADSHQHQRLASGLQVADPALVGAIHPAPRVRGEQVEHVLDAHLAQRCELLVAHPLQPIDPDRGQVAKGDLAHSTPKR